jgi:rhodanese-related sulfurtransferase
MNGMTDPGTIALAAIAGLFLYFTVRRWILSMRIPGYTAREVAERVGRTSEILLLDVRTREERSRGRVDGSIHIPLNDLAKRMQELEKHRKKEIVCYCQSGSRSLAAASILLKQGFNAANMKGGMAEWNFQNR